MEPDDEAESIVTESATESATEKSLSDSEESDVSSLLSDFDIDEDEDDSDDDDFFDKLDIKGINEMKAKRAEGFLKMCFENIKRRLGSDETICINFESKYKIE